MGIKNLHRLLQPMTTKVALNQEDWGGKRVGVDAMCWMHRGAVSCAYELIVGIDTDKFVKFFVDMVLMLQWHSIIPFIVFDGCDLPAKQEEAASRKKNRDEGREKVLEKARELGDKARFDVMTTKFAQQGIRITVDMVERILAALREMSVEFLVAPFEADAQLSFLCRTGFLHAVISEDSDLFAYNCPRVLAKPDKYGEADLFDMTKILGKENTREIPEASLNSFEKIKTAVEKEYEGLREEKVVEGVVEGTWEKIDAGGGDFDEDAEKDDHAAAPEDEEVEAEENKADGQEENGDDADAEDAHATNEEANAGGELKEGTHFLRAAGAAAEQENKKNRYDGNLLQLDEDLDLAFDERPDVEAPTSRLQDQLNRTASVASASASSAVTSSNSAGTSCTSGNNSSVEVIVLDSSQNEAANKSKIVKAEIVDLVEEEEESGPEQVEDHAEDKESETRRPKKKSSVFEQIMAEEALAEAAVKSTTKGRKGRAKRASKKEVGEGGTTGEQGNAAGKTVMKKDGKEKKAPKQAKKKAAPKKPMKKKPPQKVPNLKFDIAFFKEWTPEQFRVFCVLSGCDYNPHLHVQKLAIGTAAKLVHCFKDRTLDAVLKKFDLPCTPLEYVQNFHLSLSVFRHHVVYDAKKGDVLFFSEALKRVKRLQIQSVDPAMCETLCGCPLREKAVGDVNGMMIASGAGGKSSRGSGGGVSSCNLNDLGLGGMHHVKQNQRIPRNKNDFVRVCRGELRPKTFEERPKDPLSRAEKEMLKRLRTRRMADLRRDAELKKRNAAVGMENFASDFGGPGDENALGGAVGPGGKFSPVSINFGTASSTSRHRQSHRFVTPPSGFAGADFMPDLKRPRVAPECERSLDPSLMSFKEQVRHEEEQWAMLQRREDREWEKQQQEEREFMREHLTEVGMAVPPTVNAVIGAGGGAVGAAARCNQRPQAPPRAPEAVGMGIFDNFNGGFCGGASSSSSASAASSSSAAAGAAGLFVAGGGGAGGGPPGIHLAGVAPTGSSTGGSNDGFGTSTGMNTNINIFGMSNLSAQQQGAASRHGQPQGGTTTSTGVNKSNPFRRRGGGAAAPAQPKLSSMPNANCRPAQMNVMSPGVAGFSTTMGGAAGGGGGTGSSTSINAATRMFGNRDPRKYAEETKNNMLPYHKKKNPTGGMYF